jgi:CheY-like chemotaxis protein
MLEIEPDVPDGVVADGPRLSGGAGLGLSNSQRIIEAMGGRIDVNRLIGNEMLRRFGLDVKVAHDGAEALQLLQQHRFDPVLMDIGMPVLDGHEATRQLRERETRLKLPRVPVVALTACAFESDAAKALDAGMGAHIAKPYSREQLREIVQRWL